MLALNQTPDGSVPKNPFDLSHLEFSTSKLGQFRPIGCIETVPDGDYNVGVDNYTMTMPCNTASLGKMKENFYFIWIPYSQLINSAYSFFVNRKDLQSSMDYNDQKIPYFNLGDVVEHCIKGAQKQLSEADSHYVDIHGFNIYEGALRLLDLLGYGCYIDLLYMVRNNELSYAALHAHCTNVLNKKKPNVLRIAAYQKAWYCYFRNPIFDETSSNYTGEANGYTVTPRSFNFDDVVYHVAGQSESYDVMAHRGIDNFVRECLQLRYVGYKKDIYTGFMPGTQYGAVSSINLKAGQSISVTGSVTGNTEYDTARWNELSGFVEDPSLSESDFNSILADTRLQVDGTGGSLRRVSRVFDQDDQIYDYGTFPIRHNHVISGILNNGSGTITQGTSLFDVLQLVESQAVQKWKQKSMMAGQRSINQYRAHYGVVPRHMEDHYPEFLGSVDNEILIDRVVSNANTAPDVTDETNLGDLGGRGYGASNNRTFHCHSTEHGVIMIFAAIIPENTYSSYGLDRANQLISYTDFYQSEFQNIGLECIPKWNLDANIDANVSPNIHGDSEDYDTLPANVNVLGYAPRNYQLKQYPSKVHGRFNPARLGSFAGVGAGSYAPFGFSDMIHFVLPRLDLQSRLTVSSDDSHSLVVSNFYLTRKLFYVSPSIANSCFMIDADSSEQTDVFIHKTRIICTSVQPLSVIGLPQF